MNKKQSEKEEVLLKEAAKIKKQFSACENFKRSKRILEEAQRSIDFYEGRQWVDFKGKYPFEKPILNIISNIIDSKVASIDQKLFKIEFVVDDDQASTNKVTKFAEFQMKEMEQENLNYRASMDGLIKGTWTWLFYWDEDAIGPMGAINGSLKCALIDVKDIAVANPNEEDVQKQEYVIIRSRESLKSVKDMCDTLNKEQMNRLLIPSSYETPYRNDIEQNDEEKCTSYLKFFRQDGEVYFEKSTDNVVYQAPRPLNPLISKEIIRIQEDEQNKEKKNENEEVYQTDPELKETMNITDKDKVSLEDIYKQKYKANYYPIVIESFLKRDNCIFGRSLAYQLIPQQKIINQNIAIQTLAGFKQIMPTVVAKQGALGTRELDLTKPGGLIIDKSVGQNGFGVSVLNPGTMPSAHLQMAQSMISITKDVYRANDILDDGRNIANDLSGYAMSQLQTIQEKPVAQYQEILRRAVAREGRILEMFYKLYYRNKTFSYEFTDAELIQQHPNEDTTKLARTTTDMFDGTEYLDTPFNITVEVGETAKQSELMLTETLNTLFLNGTISKLDPTDLMMWAEMIPNYAFPKKNEFKMLLKQKQQGVIAQLQQQLAQQQQMIQERDQTIQDAEMKFNALQEEYTTKINNYNENLRQLGIEAKTMQNSQKQE